MADPKAFDAASGSSGRVCRCRRMPTQLDASVLRAEAMQRKIAATDHPDIQAGIRAHATRNARPVWNQIHDLVPDTGRPHRFRPIYGISRAMIRSAASAALICVVSMRISGECGSS